jgi:RNA polymerase sigma factor (sigma-70 family)
VNYYYIENLVRHAKAGDLKAKEDLTYEFTPFIISISSKIYIHGYEKSDLKNECFLTLFNCISKYNLDTHRFVAYATNAIKNNLNVLVKKVISKEEFDGFFSLCDDIGSEILSSTPMVEEKILLELEYNKLSAAINDNLSDWEKQLILFLYFMNNTLTNYAYHENISYVTASKRKKRVLEKLNTFLKRAHI